MALASLTRDDVLAAVAEFDRSGRAEFLEKYGFSKSKSYFLDIDDQLYDSKAIVGRALGLAASEFSGGDKTVASRLEDLGFRVRYFPVLPWARGEIVLACAVVQANGWKQPRGQDDDPRIVELSELLQTSAFYPVDQHSPDFRSTASVRRKMADIATRHPDYAGKPTKGGELDAQVVAEFLARPVEMQLEAALLREQLLGYRPGGNTGKKTPSSNGTGPVVLDVPVEAHRTKRYGIEPRLNDTIAIRRESDLVERYQKWQTAHGTQIIAKTIVLPGQSAKLRIDLYDVDQAELIEAKGSAKRDYVRFALGQILDYSRYVTHERLAVLLPNHPGSDLVQLLHRHNVDCIYETGEGAFERAAVVADLAQCPTKTVSQDD